MILVITETGAEQMFHALFLSYDMTKELSVPIFKLISWSML